MKKIVIVGGVAAGASCAARLRRLDETAEIILLERGEYISYANCGLPYHVGDVIRSRDALLVTKADVMLQRFNIDVRTQNEVTAIHRETKTITVKDLAHGTVYEESYDTLVLATGSSPLRPSIPGIESSKVMTLWTVPDTDRIRAMIQQGAKSAVVVGGGFIGLETAENLRHAGLKVAVAEALDQVMAPLDPEMAAILHNHIRENGIDLHLSDGVRSFTETETGVAVTLNSGTVLQADLVLLSIGVRPNGMLAKEAGLEVNERGGVVVDDHMRTADPSIYAVGDVIAVKEFVTGDAAMIALAGPANKQGRIAADNIAGLDAVYEGTQGTSVAKVFALTAASTGLSEKSLKRRGMIWGADYERILITQNSHAGYYPGATPMYLKLLFSPDGKKLFGAQIVGSDGVDKRIDTISVVMRLGGGVKELKNLELAYAPPYSSAKDPVNMAGFTAENVIHQLVTFARWDEPDTNPNAVLLDVREEAEVMSYSLPNAANIPLGQLRSRLKELDPKATYLIFCAIGVRGYNAARILMQNGFSHVKVYPAGIRFYRETHPEKEETADVPVNDLPEEQPAGKEETTMKKISIDCCGMQCPGPIMEVYKAVKDMENGEQLEVIASDPGFSKDVVSWCRRTGNTLISNRKEGSDYVAVIQKGSSAGDKRDGKETARPDGPIVKDTPQGKTIIVFDGDMDKVLAAFVIANGALAMGRPVTMFFTFWGLTALRKEEKQNLPKSMMEKLFGAMLPRGAKKLKLSKMNMGGMGTAMMKRIMNDKRIDSLEDMMKKAMENGVKIIACSMSMDVMGIRKEELIDGVEIGGVGTYLGDAEESNVNLFI
ncbi:MAG: FAD-dependent oxidoreductase [Oscillospiraceae bacterium]|nr:FAD-dependent oxidoreductase [Oscillospiraceae bacterium]